MNHQEMNWQQVQDKFYSDVKKHSHLIYNSESIYAIDIVRHMINSIGISENDTVLEVGAGAGRFTLHLAQHCKKLYALDTSTDLLNILKFNLSENSNINPLNANVFDISKIFESNSLDTICGIFILHHLLNHLKLFETIYQTTKSGGKIGFLEPNRINPSFLIQVLISSEMKWEAEKGMFTFSIRKTKNILEQVGFVNIKLEYFGLFPPVILDKFKF
ncbi:MAG: class I SAM-dependent methyltransferase, partial [Nanoarchaeota archaeon]|nr:class I SAM-dependent methyltransferase [Nanoarchaeota archaeon]